MEPPVLKLLTQEQVETILEESFEILKSPGIMIENDDAIELLSSSGAMVNKKTRIVSISQSLIDKCLKTTPREFLIYDLNGNVSVTLAGDHLAFRPGATALNIIDPENDEFRPPKTKDFVKWVKMIEGIPVLETQSGSMNCADIPGEVADAYRYYVMLKLSNKTACGGAYSVKGWHIIKDLLVSVAGSKEKLKEKPISIQPACPTPPLKWTYDPCQTIINNAEYGIPTMVDPMMMSGAGAPVTLEGSLIQYCAEMFAGLVIQQLKSPGAPFIWGGSPTVMDMRQGTSSFGSIETAMLGCAGVQLGRYLGLPSGTSLGITDSKVADAQAGLEAAITLFIAMLSRANFIMGPGMINFESGQCFEKLIIDTEIIQMVKRFIQGIKVTDRPVAINIFRDSNFYDGFLTMAHTMMWMKKEFYFPSEVIDRKNYNVWEKDGKLDVIKRARIRANELIKSYKPKEISKELSDELDSIMLNATKKYGLYKLPDF